METMNTIHADRSVRMVLQNGSVKKRFSAFIQTIPLSSGQVDSMADEKSTKTSSIRCWCSDRANQSFVSSLINDELRPIPTISWMQYYRWSVQTTVISLSTIFATKLLNDESRDMILHAKYFHWLIIRFLSIRSRVLTTLPKQFVLVIVIWSIIVRWYWEIGKKH